MSQKIKLIMTLSITVNVLLIGFVAWGIIKMNFVKEQVVLTEIQQNLVELEGVIAHQIDNHWSEPNIVTAELGEVLNGITLGTTTGTQLGKLSNEDKRILERLSYNLSQYPNDEQYTLASVTEQDKKALVDLRQTLREAGLGFRMTINADFNSFMAQAKFLNEQLDQTYSTKSE
ncbi:hypothetical protein [Metabacillus malikii]|uniref:Methyl-accepting chemotaxis protein n=1 Tax=Metabacillus malikii TaxID=1504265 RepID=A0ABT9ZEB9_9BACI|nr:hypothetical protein [Metabacillus malikii]MDQ0230181.1 hypothetical protein [Metabacillus malikii]